jgi:UDP-2,3-diacylglucosamine hydrolase
MVAVMHGNRDFLLGARFAQDTGCQLLPDETVVDLHGTKTLLMHGDTLCSDDHAYQQFRRMVQHPKWIADFLAKPVVERAAFAREARAVSQATHAVKQPEIMDVTPATVEATMRRHGVRRLIHGHTHRPFHHRFTLDGQPAERIVLGDWYEQGSVLTCTADACLLDSLPLAG